MAEYAKITVETRRLRHSLPRYNTWVGNLQMFIREYPAPLALTWAGYFRLFR
nr:MAG TPA: hypothetical protein [Caudoviricetes sp.]